jgi:3-hydroxybutyryl-CoA dehydrogenase
MEEAWQHSIIESKATYFFTAIILKALRAEAYFLLKNNVASFKDIDRACEMGLNHPMGPFKLADFSGLDISYNSMMAIYKETQDPKDLPPKPLRERVERGDLGRKTGKGFYDYEK